MKCAAYNNEMVKKKGEFDLRIGGKLYWERKDRGLRSEIILSQENS